MYTMFTLPFAAAGDQVITAEDAPPTARTFEGWPTRTLALASGGARKNTPVSIIVNIVPKAVVLERVFIMA